MTSESNRTSSDRRSRRREIRLEPPAKPSAADRQRVVPREFQAASEGSQGQGGRFQRGTFWRLGAAVFLGFLLLVAVAVFAVLPEYVAQTRGLQSLEDAATPSLGQGAPPMTAAPTPSFNTAEDRARAENALLDLMNWRGKVESRAVDRWGGEDLTAAMRQVALGDDHFANQRFAPAATAYENATRYFQGLHDRWTSVLEATLTEGWSAFEAGDTATAIDAFELAQAIDSKNSSAARGLARAKVAGDVARHLADASLHEQDGDLNAAARSYRAALNLDGETSEARQALARIGATQASASFAQAMSRGLAALEQREFASARAAFEDASAIRPGSAESTEGLARAEAGLRRVQIDGLRQQGLTLEKSESWQAAAEAYHQALKVDSTVAFAQEGLRRARQRGELIASIEAHLTDVERLGSAEVLAEASDLVDRARAVRDAGPNWQRSVDTLARRIAEYSRPVTVRLISDEQTDVTVYKVGRLGAFSSHALELRPGTYTVVGNRRGYRDVRRQLVIRPDTTPEPLIVRCEDPI